MSLTWDYEALENSDGDPTVVAYDEKGNKLFWINKNCGQWYCHAVEKHRMIDRTLDFVHENMEDAIERVETVHETALINHGYD